MRASQPVATVSPTFSVTSSFTQAQPLSSVSISFTEPLKTMWSSGKTDVFMRKRMRPMRPFGPVQSVR